MSDATNSKTAVPQYDIDEKAEHIQREVLAQDEPPNTIEAKQKEDALRRKLDRYVAPVMMMLMLISYLDRGNIGFAATQGMTTDIKLKGSQLNVRHHLCKMTSIQRGLCVLIDSDCSISILHLLHPRGIPHLATRQASAIQSRDTDYYILLGSGLFMHWFCAEFRWAGDDADLSGLLRRLLVSIHDAVSLQLVHERRAGNSGGLPVHRERAEWCVWWVDCVWHFVYGWGRWVGGLEVVSSEHRAVVVES